MSAGLTGPADAQPTRGVQSPVVPAIDVPYLPQTGVLCGGAALAMVLRHWGDRRVTIDEFSSLVDHEAGGIATDVLIAEAGRRGWQTVRPAGTMAVLAQSLARGHPPILLIEDRPDYYHYVVAVGLDADGVLLHDPTWGPTRRLPLRQFLREWDASGRWMLLVVPDPARPIQQPKPPRLSPAATAPASPCGAAVEEALRQIDPGGTAVTEALMEDLRRQCPGDSRPVSELAALHFASREWGEAERLATVATRLNPADEYAWDVLASSRFLQDDSRAALQAWNRVGRPRIDLVRIEGLTHTRYALVAEAAGLKPGALLTPDALERAARRLRALPTIRGVRVDYRPGDDEYARVDAAVVERAAWPLPPVTWAGLGLRAAIDREVGVDIPGPTGQGELWSGGWRWWPHRPRVWMTLSAPRTGLWPGIWRVAISHEAETYRLAGGDRRESRARASVGVERWLTSSTWYQLTTGFDAWEDEGRTVTIGARLERRSANDVFSIGAVGHVWAPLAAGESFGTTGAHVTMRSPARDGIEGVFTAGLDVASAHAPLALWSGADTGTARPRLLRAHPLLTDGVVAGPAFGRVLRYANAEASHPLPGAIGNIVRLAGFADVVSAHRRLPAASGQSWQVDVGVGLRIRVPGYDTRLRIDYGRGLRDGTGALSFGWSP